MHKTHKHLPPKANTAREAELFDFHGLVESNYSQVLKSQQK